MHLMPAHVDPVNPDRAAGPWWPGYPDRADATGGDDGEDGPGRRRRPGYPSRGEIGHGAASGPARGPLCTFGGDDLPYRRGHLGGEPLRDRVVVPADEVRGDPVR